MRGLRLAKLPFDPARVNVDLDGLRRAALRLRPRLIVLGASLFLFPHPVREAAAIPRTWRRGCCTTPPTSPV